MSAILDYYIENGELKKVDTFIDKNKGKVVYEVLKVIKGAPLFLEEHLKRFESSFKMLNISSVYSCEDIKEFIKELVKVNSVESGNIKITYDIELNNIRLFFIKHYYPTKEMYEDGVKTIFYHGERHNPNAKIVDNEFRSKVIEKIKEKNAYEAILVNNEGYITEGSKSNIFIVKNDVFYTSEIKTVLPGVTRGKVIEVLKENSFKFIERNIRFTDITEKDSMFITGTSPDILPINEVEGIKIDKNNKQLRKLMKLFEEKIKKDIE